MPRRALLFLLVCAAALWPIGHMRATLPERPLASASFGHGPAIVLVHGLGSTAEHWLPAARLLSREYRVTLVDLPGHGESEMPEAFSLGATTGSLDAALAAMGATPVVLVGHSLGGLVCAGEALAHPERVRALVLIETALRPQVAAAELPAMLTALDQHYAELVHGAYLDFGRDSAQGETLWREVAALDPGMIKRWIRLAWTADLSAPAAGLQVPVLVVLAPRSWAAAETWPDVAGALGYARLPRVHAVRLDGCGHFIMLDRPRELAALIASFAANPVTDELRASASGDARRSPAAGGI